MRKAAAIVFVAVLLLHCCIKTTLVAYYQVNKAYITENFCVNKARPAMKCNGKCYLAKQLKTQQTDESALPEVLSHIEEVVFIGCSFDFSPLISCEFLRSPAFPVLSSKLQGLSADSIFQPPRAA